MSIKPENAAILGQALVVCAYALAACVAGGLGFYFGERIGGTTMGLLMAANAALFSWLIVGALADQAVRLVRRQRP